MEEHKASARDCKWVVEPFMWMSLVQTSTVGAPEIASHVKAAWWSMGSLSQPVMGEDPSALGKKQLL